MTKTHWRNIRELYRVMEKKMDTTSAFYYSILFGARGLRIRLQGLEA